MSLFKVSSVTSLLLISGIASALKDAPRVKDIESGAVKVPQIMKEVAIDSKRNVVQVGVRQGNVGVSKTANYSNALIVSPRKVILSGHAFAVLVDKNGRLIKELYSDDKQKRLKVREVMREYGGNNEYMASVFFSDDVENDPDKANIQNQIVDVIICRGFNLGEASLENNRHDLAIALLRDPIPPGYRPAAISESNTDPFYAVSTGPSTGKPVTKEDKKREVRIAERKFHPFAENGVQYKLIDQQDQIGTVPGDSGCGLRNSVGYFGLGNSGIGEIVNGIGKFGGVTYFADNQECLERGFDALLAGEENRFKQQRIGISTPLFEVSPPFPSESIVKFVPKVSDRP